MPIRKAWHRFPHWRWPMALLVASLLLTALRTVGNQDQSAQSAGDGISGAASRGPRRRYRGWHYERRAAETDFFGITYAVADLYSRH